MTKFGNKRHDDFLAKIPAKSLDLVSDNTALRCKFNFSFMDINQTAGQRFNQWTPDQVLKLLDKLLNYGKETLEHWTKQPIGKSNQHVLEIYKTFPLISDFIHPQHVPHQVWWARFRLEGDARLIGFVIPEEYKNKEHHQSGYLFDCNTFYIVFLDKDHKFYK
jgi:hypothetical protein